jgi:ABC-type lipoprotein release transport system permease subunit
MNSLRLVWRSVVFYARSHLGTLLGAAVGAAVLVGALVVGDSVRGSLRELALLRLGKVEIAAASGDRLFLDSLAVRMQTALQPTTSRQQGQPVPAAVLSLPATAVNQDAGARANQVSLQGVPPGFWTLAPEDTAPFVIPGDGVAINEPLSRQLDVEVGDEILFRVAKPSELSRDAPLTPDEDTTVSMRLEVWKVLSDEEFGRFSLRGGQLAPLNAFVSLRTLQSRVEMPGRANLLLLPEVIRATPSVAVRPAPQLGTDYALRRANAILSQRFQLADAQLEWREAPKAGALDLRSPRVFLDAAVGDAFFEPGAATNSYAASLRRTLQGLRVTGVLTYFVNELRLGERATPYSMVTAADPPVLPRRINDDEILISQWLAEDLGAAEDDLLTLRFYVVGDSRELVEREATFTVRGVLPMSSSALDPALMPDFPGMTEAENCREWDTGLPIDTDAIRDKDETYWDDYRGTPKAFITLTAGQKLWANRFGNLTAVRIQAAGPGGGTVRSGSIVASRQRSLESILGRVLDPADFGLSLEPVRERALAASNGAQDFGQLFLGFSFFLIAAALLLMSVLFQFAMEQRAAEAGTLLALGFRPGQVRRLLLGEGAAIAAVGTALGVWGGTAYAKAMVDGLSSVWRDAVGGTPLGYHVSQGTLAMGAVSAWVVAVLTIWWALRRQGRRPARELLNEGNTALDLDDAVVTRGGRTRRRRQWSGVVAVLAFVGALASGGSAFFAGENAAAGAFFGAGALLLIAGLAGATAGLQRLGRAARANRLSMGALGLRGLTRRRRRSVATMALLASGTFLIASIGVFRLEMPDDVARRDSGTGGFTLVGASTQPVLYDLTGPEARDTYALADNLWEGAGVVPFRVRDGEEASCLNLNRAQTPRVLGVNPAELAERGAFRFAKLMPGLPQSLGWQALDRSRCAESGLNLEADEVPVIGDAASIQYALGNKVGGTLDYRDSRGRVFKLRIVGAVANSILQGNLVMAESEFVRRFPEEAGYRWFLIEAPPGGRGELAAELTRSLSDLGFEITDAAARLAEFNAVQNTYLGTFQVLGGLGLLLGSFGLGAVVLRNVLERRSELALMQALGFLPAALRSLVLREHLILLAGGLGIGILAAVIAVLPTVLLTGLPVPYASLGLTLLAVLANGALWTWLATVAALRGGLLAALRNE